MYNEYYTHIPIFIYIVLLIIIDGVTPMNELYVREMSF